MGVFSYIRCVACGHTVKPERIGLGADGAYDGENAFPHTMQQRIDYIGGRRSLRVEHLPLPMPFALGMRDALRAALARVEAEILEAGGELPD